MAQAALEKLHDLIGHLFPSRVRCSRNCIFELLDVDVHVLDGHDLLRIRKLLHGRDQAAAAQRLCLLGKLAHQEAREYPRGLLILAAREHAEVLAADNRHRTGVARRKQAGLHLGDVLLLVVRVEPRALIRQEIFAAENTVRNVRLTGHRRRPEDALVIPLYDRFQRLDARLAVQVAARLRVVLVRVRAAQRIEQRRGRPRVRVLRRKEVLALL